MDYTDIGFECHGRAWKPWAWRDEFERNVLGFRVRLCYKGGRMSFDFWVNLSGGPELESVLNCLFVDGDLVAREFDEFCSVLGYSVEFPDDERRARGIYRAVRRQAKRFRDLLGEDYEIIRESLARSLRQPVVLAGDDCFSF